MRILTLFTWTALLCTLGCSGGEAANPRTMLLEGRVGEAAHAFRAAAERGDIQAQYTLGVLLGLGTVPGGEASEAIEWYRRVAAQGNAESKFNLGQLYWTGVEARQPSQRVRDGWVERLARLGEPTTPLRVGGNYPMGSAGLQPDATEAFVWFTLAADGDHAMAWRRLAEMRLKGEGTERSLAHAHMWFSLLAERRLANSGVWLTTVRGEMSETDVAESELLLEAFRSRPTTGR